MAILIDRAWREARTTFRKTDLYKYLKLSFDTEDISIFYKGFYKFFYENGYEYDINGFSLIFFYPPHLSGLSGVSMGGVSLSAPPPTVLRSLFSDFIIFSLEFTPPDINVEKTSIGLTGTETFDYATHVHSSGETSVSYVDTDDLRFYSYHSYWIKYIHAVILGEISPSSEYITSNAIDYMGSIYCIKFDADMKTPRLISKALGIYPNSLPLKEKIGNRSQHQISLANITYTCAYFYEEPGMGGPLYREFEEIYGGLF